MAAYRIISQKGRLGMQSKSNSNLFAEWMEGDSFEQSPFFPSLVGSPPSLINSSFDIEDYFMDQEPTNRCPSFEAFSLDSPFIQRQPEKIHPELKKIFQQNPTRNHEPQEQLIEGGEGGARDDNTIKGPIITAFKHAIEGCKEQKLARFLPLIKSLKRKFVDFEKLFSIVECALGSPAQARRFFLKITNQINQYGDVKFRLRNPKRHQCFRIYSEKILRAYQEGGGFKDRLQRMYDLDKRYLKTLVEIEEFRSQL